MTQIPGPVFTNPIIPMKGRLSTGSYSGTLGQQWVGELAVPGTTKALNFADLISPTWGLSNEFESIGVLQNCPHTYTIRTIGPPLPSSRHPSARTFDLCPGVGCMLAFRWFRRKTTERGLLRCSINICHLRSPTYVGSSEEHEPSH